MAFNEILVGRLNRYVQKLLQIKNTALRTLNPDLQTVLPLLTGVEERYLQGWNRYAQDYTQAALAGNFSIGELRNPPNSSLIVVIEGVVIRGNTVAQTVIGWGVRAQTTDQGTVSTGQVIRLDPRGGPTPATILSIGTAAGGIIANNFWLVGATDTKQVISTPNQEITVLPGDAFLFAPNANNTALAVSILWRERPLESSELT